MYASAVSVPTVGWLFLMFLVVAIAAVGLFVIWVVMRSLRPPLGAPRPPRRSEGRPLRPAADGRAWPGNTTAACPECGAVLSGDAPHGLCPRCLLQRALLAPSPSPTGVPSPPGGHGPFLAPSPEELAAHFPQLEILSLLGQGGMGAVYKARQLKLDRFVALKVLPQEWGRDPAFAERFAREAKALARLSHPHIVAVHDFGEAGGYFYLLMEFVDGANLRQFLQSGPLDPRLALEVVPQICDALQYAHEEGVVHRDIKPENILLDRRGRVRIADFGLAKLVGPSRASFTLTGTHQVMGTFDYMAPEQRNHPQDVDHRADIYSLGVVFYEMLTGELPLGRFAPPSHVVGVDARIDDVVHRALEREPAQRYQHVSEVRGELESITGGAAFGAATAGAPLAHVGEYLQLQVQGPVAALRVTALAAVVGGSALGILFMVALGDGNLNRARVSPPVVLVAFLGLLVVLALATVIFAGASDLRRFVRYDYVVTAIILAMLPWSPHCLIGIPAGFWAFWTLTRPEVRAAFAANLRRRRNPAKSAPPAPTSPPVRGIRAFWRSFRSVFVSSPAVKGPPATTAAPSHVAGVDGRIDDVVFGAPEGEPEERYQRVSAARDEANTINGGAAAPVGAAAAARSRQITDLEYVQFQVQGPAAALLVTGAIALIQWIFGAVAFVAAIYFEPGGPDHMAEILMFFVFVIAFALASLVILGSVKLRRFQNYTFVVVAIILAMLPWSFHFLIGVPVGVWAFRTLYRPEVRAVFAANLRRGGQPAKSAPSPPPARGLRAFWRSFRSVFVSTPAAKAPPAATAPPSAN